MSCVTPRSSRWRNEKTVEMAWGCETVPAEVVAKMRRGLWANKRYPNTDRSTFRETGVDHGRIITVVVVDIYIYLWYDLHGVAFLDFAFGFICKSGYTYYASSSIAGGQVGRQTFSGCLESSKRL